MLNRRRTYSHTFICVVATLLLMFGYSNYVFAEEKADGHTDTPMSTGTHLIQNSADGKQVGMKATKTGQNENQTAAVPTGSSEAHTETNGTTGSNKTHTETNGTTRSNETRGETGSHETSKHADEPKTGNTETGTDSVSTQSSNLNQTTGNNETHTETSGSKTGTGSDSTQSSSANQTTGNNETHTETSGSKAGTGSDSTQSSSANQTTRNNETHTETSGSKTGIVSDSTQSSSANQTTGAAARDSPANATSVSIFLVNDLQYDIFPVNSDNGTMCDTDPEAEKCVGGLPSLKKLMDDHANSTQGLWINAGNTLGGKLFGTLKFETAIRAMNLLNFGAMAVGPGVFKYGVNASRMYLDGVKESIVVSNIDTEPQRKSRIFAFGNCSVAVVGYLENTEQDKDVWGVTIKNYTQSVLEEVERIRHDQKNDTKLITIVIGSSSVNKSMNLASIETIDVVLFSGVNWSAEAEGNKTQNESQFYWKTVNQKSSNKTAYVGSLKVDHNNMASRFIVGKIELALDSCSVANATPAVLPYTTTANNTASLEIVKFGLEVLQSQNKYLTQNSKNLTEERDLCSHSECSLGNLITDAMVAAITGDSTWSGNATRIGIFPAVHLQPNMIIPTGRLTRTIISELIDQDEYIYSVLLTGRQLKDMLEISMNSSCNSNSTDFLHVSSLLQIQYRKDHDNKSQIVSVKTVSAVSSSMQLSEIDANDSTTFYNVSVPLTLLKMDNYQKVLNAVKTSFISFHSVTIVEAVAKYINNAEALSLPVLGSRFILLETQPTPLPPVHCVDHTGTTVAVTLVVAALIVGLIFGVWRWRSIRSHLLPGYVNF